MRRHKPIVFWVMVGAIWVSSFLGGRAYGWWEADQFMANVAAALKAITPSGNCQ